MIKNKRYMIALLAGICMLILILDSKLVLLGAVDGIKLCLWTVIPSLFPFLILSAIISSNIQGCRIPILRVIGKICGIPPGGEPIMLIGFLGGYPIGAQGIMQAYSSGTLIKQDASRMLAFCNNAGPAFIFGMVSQLFNDGAIAWYLWLITVLSSVLVAISIPTVGATVCCTSQPARISIPQHITNAVKAMANICAWVILFRIILTLLQTRVFNNHYILLQTFVFGFLELSNGIVQAAVISDIRVRFVCCAVFLSAGGVCVAMQTYAITKDLGLRTYIFGKILQTAYSLLISISLIPVVFSVGNGFISLILMFVCITIILFAQVIKKSIAISKKML